MVRRRLLVLLGGAWLISGCIAERGPAADDRPGDGLPDPDAPPPASSAPYADMYELHERAIATTCSLNNGVCHNSKEYPDLRSTTMMHEAFGQPCQVAAEARSEVFDACEPEGDRLVIPSAGIDAEIARAEVSPPSGSTVELSGVTLFLVAPLDTLPAQGASDVEIHRGAQVFHVGAEGVGVDSADAQSVSLALSLGYAPNSVRSFFDDRTYPWHELMIRVADVNGNGTIGRELGVAQIVPGDPMRSYLLLRLVDEGFGDLMPRQCRTWDDRATRALGCWIEGLEVNEDNEVINADEPIDYDACTFQPPPGKCGAGATDIEAVFASSCGGSSCHIDQDEPAAGLDLSAGKARAALVGIPSTQDPTRLRVAPGSPEESYLYCKIDPACEHPGAPMPSGEAPLDPEKLEAIRDWISNGAL